MVNGEETMDDSESIPEEVPDMIANLSTVALEGMDPDNSNELEKHKNNLQLAQPERAKHYMREEWRKSMGTGSGSRKQRSNMKWARAYLPQDFPLGITLCTFNRPPHRGNWVGRYEGDLNVLTTLL
jgi:hypothetical protein